MIQILEEKIFNTVWTIKIFTEKRNSSRVSIVENQTIHIRLPTYLTREERIKTIKELIGWAKKRVPINDKTETIEAYQRSNDKRTDEWLEKRLEQIWGLLFPEVKRLNNVKVIFKGKWKKKFGHIKKIKEDSEIAVNNILKDTNIPEYIIDITLAHELVHYMHGFNSPHKKEHKHPHAGGIVTSELKKRGFGVMIKKEKEFLKKEWPKIINEYYKQESS